MKSVERAYFAGLLDGEGSIQARHRGGAHGGFDCIVSLANTDKAMVDWIAERWTGRVFTYPPRNARHKQQWLWRAHGARPGRTGYTEEQRAVKLALVRQMTVLNQRGPAT